MRIVAFSLLAAGAASALLLSTQRMPSVSADAASENFRQRTSLSGLDGVWRSRGYGWLVEISDGSVSFYDESADLCVSSDAGPDEATLSGRLEVSADGQTLRLPITDPAYLHTFDKINALPEACDSEADAAPQAVLDAMINIFTEHYAFFDERNVEWPELADASRQELAPDATETQLLNVMGNLVAKVDDAHVSLEAEANGRRVQRETGEGKTLLRVAEQANRHGISAEEMRERWEHKYWENDIDDILLDGDGVQTANDLISYGMIGDDIGYIAVRSMEGFSGGWDDPTRDIAALDRAMERAMSLFADAKAVIVDVSINYGGYDTVARALAGRFAAERTVGYYKYAGDAEAEAPQAIYVEPSDGRRYTGPVYLVTSDVTLSAAEILTMSMRALPNVTHVGEATRGALSDILSKPLPNGWSINLSNEIYLDAEGKRWEGTGIPPEVAMTVFDKDDVNSGHLEAVQAIVEKIGDGG